MNLQAGTIVVGLQLADVRQIAQDIFDANFYKLSGVASETAKRRADELIDAYLDSLAEKQPDAIDSASDPDMQYALFVAQKEYARSGDKQLAEVLVDILVDRAKQRERNLLQIVLNESIATAPKLTDYQFDILSLIFLVRYSHRRDLVNLDLLQQHLQETFVPFLDGLRRDDASFKHLEYLGCGAEQLTFMKIEEIFRVVYPGLFCKGFGAEQLEAFVKEKGIPSDLFRQCLHNIDAFQVNALNEEAATTLAKERGLEDAKVNELITIMKGHLLSDDEIKDSIVGRLPGLEILFEIWNSTPMKSFRLTSVGIAIGHANVRRRTKQEFDLSMWIK